MLFRRYSDANKKCSYAISCTISSTRILKPGQIGYNSKTGYWFKLIGIFKTIQIGKANHFNFLFAQMESFIRLLRLVEIDGKII